jgi:hypothetical protein
MSLFRTLLLPIVHSLGEEIDCLSCSGVVGDENDYVGVCIEDLEVVARFLGKGWVDVEGVFVGGDFEEGSLNC